MQQIEQRPWYREPAVKLILFALLTPAWVLVELTDPATRGATKALALVVLFLYIAVACYLFVMSVAWVSM
jgi:hypothetical protein